MRSFARSFAASLVLVLAALALLGACGDSAEQPDAGADVLPDAPPDAPMPIDLDRDGHPASTDCDDANAARWHLLPYAHRDGDGDQRTVPSAGTVCSGGRLPAGYFAVAQGADCDDADATRFDSLTGYLDADATNIPVDARIVGLLLSSTTRLDEPRRGLSQEAVWREHSGRRNVRS